MSVQARLPESTVSETLNGSRKEEVLKFIDDNIIERLKYLDIESLEEYFLTNFNQDIALVSWRMNSYPNEEIKQFRSDTIKKLTSQIESRGFKKGHQIIFATEINSSFVESDINEEIEKLLRAGSPQVETIKRLIKDHNLSFSARWRLEEKYKEYLLAEPVSISEESTPEFQYVDEVDSLGVVLVGLIREHGQGINSMGEREFESIAKMTISEFLEKSAKKYVNVPYYLKQT